MKKAVSLCLFITLVLLAASCAPHENKKAANVAYYTCTMHPSVRSQDPHGKCPICGMSLVPVYIQTNGAAQPSASEFPPHEVEFNIPPRRQQLIGVTYATVETRPLQSILRAPGVVTFDLLRRWSYVSRVEGYVEKLEVSSAGQRVEKGQPLLTLHSPDLLVAEREFVDLLQSRDRANSSNLQAAIDTARQNLDAARRRLQFWNLDDAEIERLEKARQPREYLTLYSPFQGVVWNLQTGQGRRVTAGDPLVEVVDLSAVWVWVDFYQDDLPLLTNGQPCGRKEPSLSSIRSWTPPNALAAPGWTWPIPVSSSAPKCMLMPSCTWISARGWPCPSARSCPLASAIMSLSIRARAILNHAWSSWAGCAAGFTRSAKGWPPASAWPKAPFF
jgi:biotin carboxyl carrier protein